MALRRTPWRPNRKPMRRISPKRAAKLAEQGVVNPSSTLAGGAALAVVVKRPRETGPDRATVDAVLERDGFQCVRCGGALHGERGRDWSVQHRRARGRGGSRRPDINSPQNLIVLCGSAAGCNGWVESKRLKAREGGWAIRFTEDPLLMPVDHSLHGNVWLKADGGWSSRRPTQAGVA